MTQEFYDQLVIIGTKKQSEISQRENPKAMNEKTFKIRNATIDDASDISDLSRQLGYPTSEGIISEHLNTIFKSNDHMVYVAFIPEGNTIAWIHVYKSQNIQSGSFAEIGAFIVSEKFRRKGIGKQLLEASEKWAMQKGLPKLRVRSNIKREDAKKFYPNMGFSVSKQQRVFDKLLGEMKNING